MKANGIRTIIIRGLLLIFLSLYFLIVFGQKSPNLVLFNANRKADNISLQWQLAPSNNLSTVVIEKKNADNTFQPVAEFCVNFDGNTETNFKFTDKKVKKKQVQYRLKLVTEKGEVEYSELISANTFSTLKSSPRNSFTVINKIQPTQTSDLKSLLLLRLWEREVNFL